MIFHLTFLSSFPAALLTALLDTYLFPSYLFPWEIPLILYGASEGRSSASPDPQGQEEIGSLNWHKRSITFLEVPLAPKKDIHCGRHSLEIASVDTMYASYNKGN